MFAKVFNVLYTLLSILFGNFILLKWDLADSYNNSITDNYTATIITKYGDSDFSSRTTLTMKVNGKEMLITGNEINSLYYINKGLFVKCYQNYKEYWFEEETYFSLDYTPDLMSKEMLIHFSVYNGDDYNMYIPKDAVLYKGNTLLLNNLFSNQLANTFNSTIQNYYIVTSNKTILSVTIELKNGMSIYYEFYNQGNTYFETPELSE